MDDTEYLLKTLNDAKKCKSLLKKNLTPQIQTQLKGRRTKLGGTLGDCIRSGTQAYPCVPTYPPETPHQAGRDARRLHQIRYSSVPVCTRIPTRDAAPSWEGR